MYWSFFRSKQEEMIALKELGSHLGSNLVVPIIKPHDASSRGEGQISRVLQTGLRAALIMNTNEGTPVPSIARIVAMEQNLTNAYPDQVLPTVEVNTCVTASDVRWLLTTYRWRTQY